MAKEAKDKKLTFAEMTTLAKDELHKLAKTVVSPFSKLTKTTREIADNIKHFGKIVAAMKRQYQLELNDPAGKLPKDMPFKKGKSGKRPGYWDMHAGGELPGRAETLAEIFNTLVLGIGGKPLITEEDYDLVKYSWLETANPIINDAMKEHGDNWKGCDDVLDVVNILTKRPEDGLAKLKDIRKRQKGTETPAGEGESEGEENAEAGAAGNAVPLTVGRAVEFLKAAIKNAGKLPEAEAAEMFAECMSLGDVWAESGVAEDTMERWTQNLSHGRHPMVDLATAQAA